jgi:hypothetical protein
MHRFHYESIHRDVGEGREDLLLLIERGPKLLKGDSEREKRGLLRVFDQPRVFAPGRDRRSRQDLGLQLLDSIHHTTPASTPAAAGAAFLLTQEYPGTPDALTPSTAGFLATSLSNLGGVYSFAPGVTLNPGTKYWVYGNASITASGEWWVGTRRH